MPSSSPLAWPSMRYGASTRVTRESNSSVYGSLLRHCSAVQRADAALAAVLPGLEQRDLAHALPPLRVALAGPRGRPRRARSARPTHHVLRKLYAAIVGASITRAPAAMGQAIGDRRQRGGSGSRTAGTTFSNGMCFEHVREL